MGSSPPKQQPTTNELSSMYSSLSGSDIHSINTHDLFPIKGDPSSGTNGSPMHVSMSDMSPKKLSSMDFLEPAGPMRASAPSFIPDFPSNGFGLRSHLDGRSAIHPSSAGTSPSNTSHVPSPGIQNIATSFSGTTSSLASALDGMGMTRSRSGSSASPTAFHSSDFKFTSAGSAPVHPVHPAHDFGFPPLDLQQAPIGHDSPEGPPDSHLMAIGGLLTDISKTAHSAREACSVGNGATAGVRIDELKRTIHLVSQLLAATQLADSPPAQQTSSPNYSGVSSNASHSPPQVSSMQHDPHSMNMSYHNDPSAMDVQGTLDAGEGSRKRCAPSLAGDRAMKAMKMEPVDDIPLQISTNSVNAVHLQQQTSPIYPSMPPSFSSSNPPSRPPSRPSSASMSTRQQGFVLQQQPQHSFNFSPLDLSTTPMHPDFAAVTTRSSATTTPIHATGPSFSSPPATRMPWSDGPATFPSRQHQHTNSGSSLVSAGINIPGLGPAIPFTAPGAFGTAPTPPQRSGTGMNGVSISPTASRPVGRLSRSGSMTSGAGSGQFTFNLPDVVPQDPYGLNYTKQAADPSAPQSPASSPEDEYDWEQGFESDIGGDQSQSHSPPGSNGNRGRSGGEGSSNGRCNHHNQQLASHSPGEPSGGTSSSHGNEVPQEYRAEVDRVFFDFLSSICSNLEATDSKGEPIHQTLMAKKMQRLDESTEFRPFKFRIQAFTNAFLEELARQGYPEEKIPMKKIRNYLWNQTYISRFNEDGKKAKSKGNHIWNIQAKKKPEGGWTFSPFHRRLAGTPHGVAYVGLRWTWAPRIWDPQASRNNVPVTYTSPNLPSWLSWKDDQLSGAPPPDAESCDITVEARFTQDGQEEMLSQTVHVNIAPMSTLDTSFSPSRRPSLVGDISNSRRGQSDPVAPQLPPRTILRPQNSANQLSNAPASQDTQVIQVLTTAAQRVAQEAQSQVVASRMPNEPTPALELLAKQQHVLTVTAQALDSTIDSETGSRVDNASQSSHVLALASAAQNVVMAAARTVTADRTALNMSMGLVTSQSAPAPVTVNEVSVATQSAVAQAVGLSGPLSSEVDVLMTASSLLQQHTRNTPPASSPPATVDPSQISNPLEPSRPHSTATPTPRQQFLSPLPSASGSAQAFTPSSLCSMPEYVQL